ncbi:MAG: hypothetical protein ACK5RO_11215 [Pseudobdellovibrionaceae bacterium]|jgi:hypothetical protein
MKQLELGIERPKEADRNYHLGGRSFYFFDFDDNVAFLTTPLILFHKVTREELNISSGQFATEHSRIGKSGIYQDFEINWDDVAGTFRNFRDHHNDELERLGLQTQIFINDVAHALGFPDFHWKGPSWSTFYHAAFNQRPVSVITARGHNPETIKRGVEVFVKQGHLPSTPNYLSIYPVSHKPTRILLGDSDFKMTTAELKQAAIRASVERALDLYGYSPHHRFGMSDDDPKNIELITEELTRLKARYPEMKFYMIETQNGEFVKNEIFAGGPSQPTQTRPSEVIQPSLFSST